MARSPTTSPNGLTRYSSLGGKRCVVDMGGNGSSITDYRATSNPLGATLADSNRQDVTLLIFRTRPPRPTASAVDGHYRGLERDDSAQRSPCRREARPVRPSRRSPMKARWGTTGIHRSASRGHPVPPPRRGSAQLASSVSLFLGALGSGCRPAWRSALPQRAARGPGPVPRGRRADCRARAALAP